MNRVLLKSYVDKDLKEVLSRRATGAGVSLSQYVERVLQGEDPPSHDRREMKEALLKVNADQARLGNLLRLALDDDDWRSRSDDGTETDVDSLIINIREMQEVLKEKAGRL